MRSLVVALAAILPGVAAGESSEERFRSEVLPILTENCFACHGYGSSEGGLALDQEPTDKAFLQDTRLWWSVLKNVRAGVMPPDGMPSLAPEQQGVLADWVKTEVFGLDPENVDPGPASVRRLNRFEYGNTIRDLMGIDFNAELIFPPDDSGFGFDNVGEAQTLSPLLIEKYLHAAKTIVDQAVPTVSRVVQFQELDGWSFRDRQRDRRGNRMSLDEQATVSQTFELSEAGEYRVVLRAMVDGSFEFHPRRAVVRFLVDGEQRSEQEHGWHERLKIEEAFDEQFDEGEHQLTVEVEPLPLEGDEQDEEERRDDSRFVNYFLQSVKVEGPLNPTEWQQPPNYSRFFHRDEPPADEAARREYAAEVLRRFTTRAFRRPADEATIERLTDIAERTYQQPDTTFEAGVAHAMVAVLASPRFLLRVDLPAESDAGERFPDVDEYSLASRLSYFFWATMPDEELLDLAAAGKLRENLDAQVDRLLSDERSQRMIRSFVGQWLRARDVENVTIDPLAATGLEDEYEQVVSEFRRQFRRRDRRSDEESDDEESRRRRQELRERLGELREIRELFDGNLRQAMRRETEMMFEHIVDEDRSALELLDSDYTFLNQRLADFYGIEGIEGNRFRKVPLPAESPRGGVLTQGTMLTVTSNPTRTSPVKRGFFILDNLLGTPPPPAPPNVPELEAAAEQFGDREPTLREVLELHRDSPLCSSCHARMDPLGLALENFDALGRWREEESGQPIDASGELVSGETFDDIRELKQILITEHRRSFYRCLAEKMLTYALGRGLDYYDVHTVDVIVDKLDNEGGRMGVLIDGIVHSAPFQRHRGPEENKQAADGPRTAGADANRLADSEPSD